MTFTKLKDLKRRVNKLFQLVEYQKIIFPV